jgi:excisionase family DNA binding protein
MPELDTVPAKTYARRPSPLLAQQQRCLEIRRAIVADPLLSTQEICRMLGCSYSHLRDLIHRKEIAIWRVRPRAHIRVKLSEIQRYLASGVNGGQSNG